MCDKNPGKTKNLFDHAGGLRDRVAEKSSPKPKSGRQASSREATLSGADESYMTVKVVAMRFRVAILESRKRQERLAFQRY